MSIIKKVLCIFQIIGLALDPGEEGRRRQGARGVQKQRDRQDEKPPDAVGGHGGGPGEE